MVSTAVMEKGTAGFDRIANHRPLSNNAVGGVAIALESLIKEHTRVYVVDNQKFYPPDEPRVMEELNGIGSQVRVRVPQWAMKANYEGLANGILWPANHDMIGLIESERPRIELTDWVRGNNLVTSRITQELLHDSSDAGDLGILVNDYQITGVGKGTYFHHTPFFSPETFYAAGEMQNGDFLQGVLKRHVEQLMAYDAVGVQTKRDLENLQVLTELILDNAKVYSDGNLMKVIYNGNTTLIKAVPIGTDPEGIEKSLEEGTESIGYKLEDGRNFKDMLKEDVEKGRYVIARVGRADYTKAHPENMDFIYHFATRCAQDPVDPQLFRAYVVAAETRSNVPAYQQEMDRINSKAEELNSGWRSKGYDYDLIELITQEVPHKTCLALMKAADVYVDISAKDGMHLTPQENVVAKGVGDGFVVCSINSGTGYLLRDAGYGNGNHGLLVVNSPSRITAETAGALYKRGHGISDQLLDYVKRNNVYEWSRNLEELSLMNR